MATNHLPHLHHADQLIFASVQDIAKALNERFDFTIPLADSLPEPPPIDFFPAGAIKQFRDEKHNHNHNNKE